VTPRRTVTVTSTRPGPGSQLCRAASRSFQVEHTGNFKLSPFTPAWAAIMMDCHGAIAAGLRVTVTVGSPRLADPSKSDSESDPTGISLGKG
jgi:hypothetical protein